MKWPKHLVLLGGSVILPFLSGVVSYTWPDERIDELDELRYNPGAGPQSGIFPCSTPASDATGFRSGRTNAAEWLRTAYHDMATADVSTGVGGLDASIAFEQDRPENVGKAFDEALEFFRSLHSVRVSMSDLIALGAIVTLQSCSNGAIRVPFRGGRVDATTAGVPGVPQPHENITSHSASFARTGFNVTEMIGLVACGHSLGGVHRADFPDIADDLHDPNNTESVHTFDTTGSTFDNNVAKEFLANSTQNVLAFGPNVTTRSDFRVFTADGGETIRRMASSTDIFMSTCQGLMERMVNTVPGSVKLTDRIAPIRIKPTLFETNIMPETKTMTIWGSVRILEDGSTSPNRVVKAHLKPRDTISCQGNTSICGSSQTTRNVGDFGSGRMPGDPEFTMYAFNFTIPMEQGGSSLVFELSDNGQTIMETNGGGGFPVNSVVFPAIHDARSAAAPWTCANETIIDPAEPLIMNKTLQVKAAVWDSAKLTSLSLVNHIPVGDYNAPIPRFGEIRAPMVKVDDGRMNGTGYSIYTGSVSYVWNATHPPPRATYDIVGTMNGQAIANTFNTWALPSCP